MKIDKDNMSFNINEEGASLVKVGNITSLVHNLNKKDKSELFIKVINYVLDINIRNELRTELCNFYNSFFNEKLSEIDSENYKCHLEKFYIEISRLEKKAKILNKIVLKEMIIILVFMTNFCLTKEKKIIKIMNKGELVNQYDLLKSEIGTIFNNKFICSNIEYNKKENSFIIELNNNEDENILCFLYKSFYNFQYKESHIDIDDYKVEVFELQKLLFDSMKDSYRIVERNTKEFKYIVYSLDYLRLEEYIYEVVDILKEKQFKGLILFDLFMCNGDNINNRYFSAVFDGKKFDLKTFRLNKNIDSDIINYSSDFYKNLKPCV